MFAVIIICLCANSEAKEVGLSIMDFSGHWNFVAKILGIFFVQRFLGEVSKPPTNKDLAFVTVPVSFIQRWHLLDTSTTPCTRAQKRKTNMTFRALALRQPRFQGPLSSYLEKVPWLRLVTCLLDFCRFQRCDWREGLESYSLSQHACLLSPVGECNL